MPDYSDFDDLEICCIDCEQTFIWTSGDQLFSVRKASGIPLNGANSAKRTKIRESNQFEIDKQRKVISGSK